MGAQLPEDLLYRLRQVNPNLPDQERQILHDSKLWFATPDTFNDPYELKPKFVWSKDGVWSNADIRSLVKRQMPNATKHERRKVEKEIRANNLNSRLRAEYRRKMEADVDSIYRSTSICAFTRDPANLLMWSHYAGTHAGYCLGYDFSGEATFDLPDGPPSVPLLPDPVIYQPGYPEVDLDVPRDDKERRWDAVKTAMLTKSSEWAYEREERMVRPAVGKGFQSFPASDLRVLILGAKISAEHRDKLMSLVRSRPLPIRVLQARLAATTYGMEFDDVAP